MELKELTDKLAQEHTRFKELNDRSEAELKARGAESAETKAAVKAANDALQGIEDRIKELSAEVKRGATLPAVGTKEGDAAAAKARGAAFEKWARKGDLSAMAPEEVKLLSAAQDTQAGYLATPELTNEIIKAEIEFSPMRSLARVRQTSQRSVQVRKRTGVFAAQWGGEIEPSDRAETTGLKYGLEDTPVHELYAIVDVTMQDLEDSAFNLEAELTAEMAEQFGVAEGAAFVSGNAVKKPEGFLTNADVGYTPGTDASLIKADGLLALYYGVKTAYAQRGVFVLNRATLAEVRKLKDTTNQYLWQALGQGAPPTINGAGYVEMPDMPDIASNAFPVAFGDWRRAYQIVDRISISVVRDGLTRAAKGQVRFIGRKRVAGQVVLAEAIRKLKIATS